MEDCQTLAIKGMVCNRCITVLTSALEAFELIVKDVHLGKITVCGLSKLKNLSDLESQLASLGFEVLQNRDEKLVDRIKAIVRTTLQAQSQLLTKVKFSKILSEQLHGSYDSLSAVFAKTEGITLESFIIIQRLDKIKECIVHTELPLTQIAYLNGYSSVFHLSRQFKHHTGITPSHFRRLNRIDKSHALKHPNNIKTFRNHAKNSAG